ncbi:hypothetical protein D9M72_403740 [compost metagenome]
MLQLLVGVAFDGRARLDLVGQAVVNTRQDGRHHQIGVGVGAGHSVLDAHGIGAAGGHSNGHGAVVQAPARRVRHVELCAETAVGVHVRAQEGHGRGHGLEHTADCVTQSGVLLGIIGSEDVLAGLLVDQRDVHVQTVTRLARIGLGHEGGVHFMVVGDVLDQTLEQHRVVAGLQGVFDVVHVDFELGRGAFLDDGVGRDALDFGAFEDVLQAVGVFVQIVDQVHLGGLRTLAGNGRTRRLRTTVYVLLVDQVELQFECGADGQAEFIEFFHHTTQDLARVGEEGFAFEFVHGHQQLRGRALLPGFVAEGAGDGIADAVCVADVQAQPGAFDGGTVDIESEDRSREVDAFFVDFGQAGAFDSLASHHSIHICDQQVDELDLRMFLKEFVRFLKLNGTRGYRHDATPFLLKISITLYLRCESIRITR